MSFVNSDRFGLQAVRVAVCAALIGALIPVGAGAAEAEAPGSGVAPGIKEQRLADVLTRGGDARAVGALAAPDFSSATPVLPGTVTGTFAATDTYHVYSVALGADERVSLRLSAAAETNFDLRLYREPSSLGVVGASLLDAYPETIVHDVRVPHAGTYYVVVERFSGAGAYTLDVATSAAPVLGPIHAIPGVPLTLPAVTGVLDRGTEPDHVYSIALAAGERLSLVMHSVGGDADVFVFGPGAIDVTVDRPVAGAATSSDPELLVYDVPAGAGGTYFVNVWAASGSPAYELTASVTPTPLPGPHVEIPGVPAVASPLVDTIGATGESRVYALPAAVAGQRISLSLHGAAGTDFDLRLFAPGATSIRVAAPVKSSALPGYPDTIVYDVPAGAGGVYYVQVFSHHGRGAFALSWSIGARTHATIQRLWGQDRFLTAVDISRRTFAAGSVDTVILATGADFPDALAASGLAGAHRSPVLLTPSTRLPVAVLSEMRRLGARKVLIIGGTAAVSAAVETTLRTEFGRDNVKRIGGSDRFATAAAVAVETIAQVNRAGLRWDGDAFVVRSDGFADALAVAPLAYARTMPVLLTRTHGPLHPSTRAALTSIGAEEAIVAGGTGAVGETAVTDLRGVGAIKRVDRIAGRDRFETAARVAEYALRFRWAGTGVVGVATGSDFPDALSGGSAAGAGGGVLLLTRTASLPAPSADFLGAHQHHIPAVHVYGGAAAVSNTVIDEISRIAP